MKFRGRYSTEGSYLVDWATRDAEYNAAVEAAAFRLRQVDPSKALSQTALMKEAGIPQQSGKYCMKRVPATMATIARLTK